MPADDALRADLGAFTATLARRLARIEAAIALLLSERVEDDEEERDAA